MNPSRIVKIAKALADPTRLRMLRAIRAAGELNCSQVCEKFPLSQPTISHHVRTLESAGLITVRREGQFHVLGAADEVLAEFTGELTGIEPRARRRAKPRAPRKRAAARTA